MQRFVVHTLESAPEKSRQPLQVLKQKFGFVPNVAAAMAASPVLINAFIGGFASFHGGSFSESEKQALLLTNAVTLKCPWAVAFHSTMALQEGVASSDVRAIRDGKLPADARYAALSAIAKALIEKRGNVTEADIENFTSVGYSQVQILEVVTGIGMSTMASTTGNLAGTPVEDPSRPRSGLPPELDHDVHGSVDPGHAHAAPASPRCGSDDCIKSQKKRRGK
jgi:alkylhydroperoxidase family enzyme